VSAQCKLLFQTLSTWYDAALTLSASVVIEQPATPPATLAGKDSRVDMHNVVRTQWQLVGRLARALYI
jgi:hypothetical protein